MTDAWHQLVLDLDRCEHGRHEGDVCGSCGGPSKGNPLWAFNDGEYDGDGLGTWDRLLDRFGVRGDCIPDRLIGFGLDGVPICIPERVMGRAPTPEDYYLRGR